MVGWMYLIIIILANTVGSLSGMGGGVLIKPLFDLLGYHSMLEISFYSSVAVFTMSLVSTYGQLKNKIKINPTLTYTLSIGSVLGGILGSVLLNSFVIFFTNEKTVELIQMILFIVTLLFSYFYSLVNLKGFDIKNKYVMVSVGILLGGLASFLGIGGGPINVALVMFLFWTKLKEATVYSIIMIFCSQLFKLLTIYFTTGFGSYDKTILLYIIPAAIIGGFIGARLSGKLSDRAVKKVYQLIIICVLLLTFYNIWSLA